MMHTVERRAREEARPVAHRAAPARPPAPQETPQQAALTRRERKVKDLLLKELAKMNGETLSGGLSYAEKQYLEKSIDVAFIDKELAKMRRQLRWLPKMLGVMALLFAVTFGYFLWEAAGDGLEWTDLALVAPILSGMFSPFVQIRSIKRRIFIFEALRELSDADEAGVQLGDAVRRADELIERIVQLELDGADAYALPDPTTRPARQRA